MLRRLTLAVAGVAMIATLAACTSSPTASTTETSATDTATTGTATATAPTGPAADSAVPASAGASDGDFGVAVPALAWGACPPAAEGGASTAPFQCATATVPIDYPDPAAGSFELAVIKYPATDQAGKLGTVFWNPGGPSDAGTEFLPVAYQGFPDQVHERFDIVSWDPRGMGGATTPVVQCFDSAAAEAQFLAEGLQGISLPVSDEELARFTDTQRGFNEACGHRNGDLLAHVSTADNARDLDLLRQAVGEDEMNYYGTSYGTFLGATYLNMFPDKVRTAVMDGAVAPAAWAGNDGQDLSLSTFLRIGSDLGGTDTLNEFMRQCGAVDASACAFSAGSPQATLDKFGALVDRAKGGIVVDGEPLDDRSLLAVAQSQIYVIEPVPGFARFPGWVAVAQFLQQAWEASEAPPSGVTAEAGQPAPESSGPSVAGTDAPAEPQTYVTSAGRQRAVICGESPNPTATDAIAAQARVSYDRAGLNAWPFGAMCPGWTTKAADPYLGPWNTPSVPVLVVGNTFDPATPYTSSQRMADELADGHLLTVDGFGHTELINPSTCAQDHIAAYYLDRTLPADGTRCEQDGAPFGP